MKGLQPFTFQINRSSTMKIINETDVCVLKTGSCDSVSGKSTLTYHIGESPDGEIHLRVHANTAAGFFSQEWVPLESIDKALGSHFTSSALQSVFTGKSQNTPAFMLAVLLQEGLVIRATDKKRCYSKTEFAPFIAEIKALMVPDKKASARKSKTTLPGS
jgi:hypothetical protein